LVSAPLLMTGVICAKKGENGPRRTSPMPHSGVEKKKEYSSPFAVRRKRGWSTAACLSISREGDRAVPLRAGGGGEEEREGNAFRLFHLFGGGKERTDRLFHFHLDPGSGVPCPTFGLQLRGRRGGASPWGGLFSERWGGKRKRSDSVLKKECAFAPFSGQEAVFKKRCSSSRFWGMDMKKGRGSVFFNAVLLKKKKRARSLPWEVSQPTMCGRRRKRTDRKKREKKVLLPRLLVGRKECGARPAAVQDAECGREGWCRRDWNRRGGGEKEGSCPSLFCPKKVTPINWRVRPASYS